MKEVLKTEKQVVKTIKMQNLIQEQVISTPLEDQTLLHLQVQKPNVKYEVKLLDNINDVKNRYTFNRQNSK
jgi:hypothetical protein